MSDRLAEEGSRTVAIRREAKREATMQSMVVRVDEQV
jgi:hypothetical protein